jgi:hypothetical protein
VNPLARCHGLEIVKFRLMAAAIDRSASQLFEERLQHVTDFHPFRLYHLSASTESDAKRGRNKLSEFFAPMNCRRMRGLRSW